MGSIFERLKGYSISPSKYNTQTLWGHQRPRGTKIPLVYFTRPKPLPIEEYNEVMEAMEVNLLVDEKTINQNIKNTEKKWIYIIAPVRDTTPAFRRKLDEYSNELKRQGYKVYLPHRDTDQRLDSLGVNQRNREAIEKVDEVHIFYNSDSQGSHFDLGMAYAFGKRIVVIENELYGRGKSYAHFLDQLKEQEDD